MPFIAFLLLSCWSILFSLLTPLFVEPFSDGVVTSLKICSFGVRTRLQKDWNPILSGHLRPLQAAIFTSRTAAADGQNIWCMCLRHLTSIQTKIPYWTMIEKIQRPSWSVLVLGISGAVSSRQIHFHPGRICGRWSCKDHWKLGNLSQNTQNGLFWQAKWWQNALRAKEALESAWNCLHHKEPTACFRNGTSNNFMRICWELRSCNICGHVPI